jgi:hypothetical protein
VFFFACHVDDAAKAIGKVFERPLAELFRGELRCADRDSIIAALETLEDEIAELPPPDYSSLVESAPLAAASANGVVAGAEGRAATESSDAPSTGSSGIPLWDLADAEEKGAEASAAVRPPRPTALPLKAGE